MGLFPRGCALLLAAIVAIGPALPARASGTNQNTALLDNDSKNRQGSDKSLENSATYAMTALMNLASSNVPGAIKNGTTAYGKYRNSETMDKIGDQSFNAAASLSSVGGSEVSAPRKTDTTFRRLDPKFLRTGEAAKVAEEFEKKSGMSRDQFLQVLADVSEQKIPRNDPQLVDKVLSRYESFAAKIPNAEFRNNLQKAAKAVPSTMRNGLIAQAVSKFSNFVADLTGPSSDVSAATPPAPETAAAAGTDTPGASQAASEAFTGESRAPASGAGAENPLTLGTLSAPVAEGKSTGAAAALTGIVQAAIETQGQDLTIFQIVSRKYRALTPTLRPAR